MPDTPDLDEIRAALAAATHDEPSESQLVIAALCDEIERLRAQITDQAMTDLVRETERLGLYQTEEIEHLRAKQKRLEDGWEAEVARLVAVRDAADAAVLRRFADGAVVDQPVMLAAIERAIELLSSDQYSKGYEQAMVDEGYGWGEKES